MRIKEKYADKLSWPTDNIKELNFVINFYLTG